MAVIEVRPPARADKPGDGSALLLFDTFLCHVSRRDGALASRLKDGLEKLGRAKGKAFALKVFLDQHSVGAGELPSQIQKAIDSSRYLVVLVRPELHTRPWCVDEIGRWLSTHKDPTRLLLVLSAGSDLRFANGALQFSSTAERLPEVLVSAFASEPSWIDLRKMPKSRDDDWWMRLGKLASPIHGVEPETLWSRQIAEQRRSLNWARAAILSLTFLAGGLTNWVWQATLARNDARAQTRASTQRGLAAKAMLELVSDPVAASESVLKAHAADPEHALPELQAALTEVVQKSRLVRRLEPPMGTFGQIRALVWAVDGERLLVASDSAALVLNRAGFAISNPVIRTGEALSANAGCALASGGFVLAYGHRVQGAAAASGLLWLDADGRVSRDAPLPAEALSVACEGDDVAVGTDRGVVYRASVLLPDLVEERQIDGEPPINAVVWANAEAMPVAGTASRGSGGMPVMLGTSEAPMVIDVLAQPSNVLAAVPFASGFALATQSGSIQLLQENMSGTGWIADPNVAFNGHVGPVWALQTVGRALISGGADQRIRVWRDNGGELVTLAGHRAAVTALAWDARERRLFSGDLMGSVLVWDLPELADATDGSAPLAWNRQASSFVERESLVIPAHEQLPSPGDVFERLVVDGDDVYWLNGNSDAETPLRAGKLSDAVLREIALPNDRPTAVLPLPNAGLLVGGGYANGVLGLKSTEAALKALRADMPELTVAGQEEHAIGLFLFKQDKLQFSVLAAHEDSLMALASCVDLGRVRYASGGADGRVVLWSKSLERVDSLALFSDVESTVVTALQFSSDGNQLYVGIKTEAMNLGSEHGWLLAFDVSTRDLAWRQDLLREIPVAVLAAGPDQLVIHTRRFTSPTDMSTVENLLLIQSNGQGLSTLAADLTDTLVAVGVDPQGVLQVADAAGRRLTYDVTVLAQVKRLAARQAFHQAHASALEQVTRAERALTRDDRATAITAFRAALVHELRSPEIRMRLAGQLTHEFKTLDEAISIYGSVIEDMPKMSLPRYQRGRTLLFANRFAEAEADFTVALEAGSEVFTPVRQIDSSDPTMVTINATVRQAAAKFEAMPRLELRELRAFARLQQGNQAGALEDARAALAGGRKTDRLDAIMTAATPATY